MNNQQEEKRPASNVTVEVGRRLRALRRRGTCPSTTSNVNRPGAGAPRPSGPTSRVPHPEPAEASRARRVLRRARVGLARGADTDDRGSAEARARPRGAQPGAEAAPVQRFVRSIIIERGDYNGRVLTIRRDDLRAICALLQLDVPDAIATRGLEGARREPIQPRLTFRRRATLLGSRPSPRGKGFDRRAPAQIPSRFVALVIQKFGGTSVPIPIASARSPTMWRARSAGAIRSWS